MMKQYRLLSKNIIATKCGSGICMCIYIYTYVYMYMYMCVYICICVYVYVRAHIYTQSIYKLRRAKTVGNTSDNHSALVRG